MASPSTMEAANAPSEASRGRRDEDSAVPSASDVARSGTKRKRSPKPNMKFYAVRNGRTPGVYHSWTDCLDQVRGFPKAVFKAFASLAEAEAFIADDSGAANGTLAGKSGKFYAVREGRVPGVYGSWPEVLEQITGWKLPKHKVFKTREEAEFFVKEGTEMNTTAVKDANIEIAESAEKPKPKKTRMTPSQKAAAMAGAMAGPMSGPVTVGQRPGPNDDNWTSIPTASKETPAYEPGTAPLPTDAHDGFDTCITLDQSTGSARYKTAAEFAKTKYHATGPAPQAPVRIYTDGSTLSNGRLDAIAGVGVYFGPKDRRNISEPLGGTKQSNQRAELTAILRALEVAPRDRRVIILSDSQYAIKCVTEWHHRWRQNNWTTSAHKPVENRDLIQKIIDMLEDRMRLNQHRLVVLQEKKWYDDAENGPWEQGPAGVKFTWVKGHSKDEGNSAADELAVNGARTAREFSDEVVLD